MPHLGWLVVWCLPGRVLSLAPGPIRPWVASESPLVLSCVHVEVGAGVGWTVYPPHSRRIGIGVDVAIVSLHLSGLSSLAGSINVLTTILLMRGPALAMQRVPLFVWGVLITNLLLLLALPVLAGALTMLLTDRN